MVSITPNSPSWTGAENLTFEASHATGEVVQRTSKFVVYDPQSNFPRWEPPADSSRMLVYGALPESEDITEAANYQIAAFVDGELRGVADAILWLDRWIFQLDISESTDSSLISFKTYNMRDDLVVNLAQTATFAAGTVIGDPVDPFIFSALSTASEDVPGVGLPVAFALEQNYPNPFNPTTLIQFSVPRAGNVRIVIYDQLGKEVHVLVDKYLQAGKYLEPWKAENLASGVYMYRMDAGSFMQTRPMLLIK